MGKRFIRTNAYLSLEVKCLASADLVHSLFQFSSAPPTPVVPAAAERRLRHTRPRPSEAGRSLIALIAGTATTAKKAPLSDPFYVDCTKTLFVLESLNEVLRSVALLIAAESEGAGREGMLCSIIFSNGMACIFDMRQHQKKVFANIGGITCHS